LKLQQASSSKALVARRRGGKFPRRLLKTNKRARKWRRPQTVRPALPPRRVARAP
jgi:hypothetical protein